jgi:hypothetical protein
MVLIFEILLLIDLITSSILSKIGITEKFRKTQKQFRHFHNFAVASIRLTLALPLEHKEQFGRRRRLQTFYMTQDVRIVRHSSGQTSNVSVFEC